MNDSSNAVAERHSSFLKSLLDFSKEHRAAHWEGSFGSFLESVFPADPRGVSRIRRVLGQDLGLRRAGTR